MQVTAVQNISGIRSADSPFAEVAPSIRRSDRDSPFGPAYVRSETGAGEESGGLFGSQYGPDARLRAGREESGNAYGSITHDPADMSASDRELLQRLERRDAMVRGHESAHIMAAGGQAGMPSYTYQTGPDGKRYAIGGSVNISIMTTGDHEADATRAAKAARAALAAGDPSAADMETAAKAASIQGRAMRRAFETYAEQAQASPWQLLGL